MLANSDGKTLFSLKPPFSQPLYTCDEIEAIFMDHDEPEFEKKLRKFSVIKECPKCKQLSLSFRSNSIYCTNCGYEEQLPAMR